MQTGYEISINMGAFTAEKFGLSGPEIFSSGRNRPAEVETDVGSCKEAMRCRR